jgi:tetratricopeptide (TPR) repeat protein
MRRSATKTKIADDLIDRTRHARATDAWRALCAALLLVPSALFAQSPEASTAFAQARAAFERQDFASALTGFEAALAAGLVGPAIHYNIGVAAYKLQRYDRARQAFEEAARTASMAPLAHYNLGLIARAQGDDGLAREYFERVLAESADERLTGLARSSLEDSSIAVPETRLVWAAFGSTAVGYDDNVTLISNGQALGIARESDVYFDGLFAGSVRLSPKWRVDADVAYLKYADLDEYDQLGLGAGGRYRMELAQWTTELGGQLGSTYIGGDSFEQRQAVFAQASRTLANDWSTRARYRLSNINGTEEYEGLDGLRHELSARLTYTDVIWTVTGAYLFEVSDFDSASLSATRHQLSLDSRVRVAPEWMARAAIGLRSSKYDAPSIGTENRIELSAGAEYELNEHWTIVAQYLFSENDARESTFDYQRNRIQVAAEVAF